MWVTSDPHPGPLDQEEGVHGLTSPQYNYTCAETLFQNQKSGSIRVWAKRLAMWEGRAHGQLPDVVGCESCAFVHLLWPHPCFTIEIPWLCHSGKREHPFWICIIFLFQPGWNSLPCRGAGSIGWPDSLRKYQEMLAGQNWSLYLKENNVLLINLLGVWFLFQTNANRGYLLHCK